MSAAVAAETHKAPKVAIRAVARAREINEAICSRPCFAPAGHMEVSARE